MRNDPDTDSNLGSNEPSLTSLYNPMIGPASAARVLDALPANVAVLGRDGVILSVNEPWRQFARNNAFHGSNFGVGQNYLQLCGHASGDGAEGAGAVAEGLRSVLTGERAGFVFEYPCHSAHERRWFRMMATPLELDSGRGAVVMHINITERKLAEDSARLQVQMLDQIGQAVVAADLRGTVFYANRHAREIYGWTEQIAYGAHVLDLAVAESSRAAAEEALGQVRRGHAWTGELMVRRTDGSTFPAFVNTSPLLDSEGRVSGALGISFDITARKKAEEELQHSQALLRMAARISRLGAWRVEAETFHVTWSDEVRRIHEVPADYLPTVDEAMEFYFPEHRSAIRQAVEACMRDGVPFDLELEIRTARGRKVAVRAMGEAVRDPDRRILRVQGAFQDISEQKRVEQSLRESEERFRMLSCATNDAVWDWDITRNTLWWNDGFEQLFGFKRSEIEPDLESWTRRIHPEDRDKVLADLHQVLESAQTDWSAEYRFIRKDGRFAWVLDRGYIIRDASGKAIRAIGGMTDQSERKRAEERIAEQAALLDIARDAILVRDLEDRIIYWNKSAARTYGWTAEEALGRNASELLREDQGESAKAREMLFRDGEWNGELIKRTKNGRELTIQVRYTLVRNARGEPKAILAINSDITEKKTLQAQFLRAQRMESIGTLAGGIAHDLNNVLAPIMMSLSLLEESVPPDGRELVETLQVSAQRAADLVRQVLSFARGVEGQRSEVNLVHILREIQNIVRDTFPKNIRFNLQGKPPNTVVLGDATQLHQVFTNLSVNARDAMPNGGQLTLAMENIRVDEVYASLHPDAKPGDYVVVSVADTGTGISREIREKVFEPFFTTKEIGRGTGLGLSTSLAIVKSHGGFIHLYSEVGQGTKFKVFLPVRPASPDLPSGGREALVLPHGNGECVLVIDDEESVRQVAKQTLERYGYQVLLAANGAEGISTYARQTGKIDVVLTDLAMPIMDGPATIVALRTLNPEVRIVASSGLAANDSSPEPLSGVDHFVPKPYTAEVLLRTLQAALARKKNAPPAL